MNPVWLVPRSTWPSLSVQGKGMSRSVLGRSEAEADDFGWVPDSDAVRWDVCSHDGACTDYCPFADCHTAENYRARPDPDISTDVHFIQRQLRTIANPSGKGHWHSHLINGVIYPSNYLNAPADQAEISQSAIHFNNTSLSD